MHLTYHNHEVERAGQASADVSATRFVALSPHMIAAEVDAYLRWNKEEADMECLIAEIFLSMVDAQVARRD